MTTGPITSRFMIASFLGLALALLLPACGRSLLVTVVDEQSHTAIEHANVYHHRHEWRFLGILPVQRPILKAYGQTNANGQIVFDDVRDADDLTVEGPGVDRIWFSPLRPLAKTQVGPDPNVPAPYRRVNADAPADCLTLPVPRRQP